MCCCLSICKVSVYPFPPLLLSLFLCILIPDFLLVTIREAFQSHECFKTPEIYLPLHFNASYPPTLSLSPSLDLSLLGRHESHMDTNANTQCTACSMTFYTHLHIDTQSTPASDRESETLSSFSSASFSSCKAHN